MARPSKTAAIDYAAAHDLTHGLLERAICPPDRPFVLVKDADKKGLRLRVTKAGGKHWQFETRMKGKLITRALGEWPAVSIADAKAEAHRLRGLTETGIDPRELEHQQQAAQAAEKAAAAAHAVTVGEVWAIYLEARRPRWGERHYSEHLLLVKAGGVPSKRAAGGVTAPGILHPLMALPLRDLTTPVIEAWAEREAQTRPAAARLAWRCLKAFLSWCAEQKEYAPVLAGVNPAKTKKARESLGKAGVKEDALLKEQLPAWFDAVRQLQNPMIAAYLQTLLLTGARAGEVLGLRWEDINIKWRGLTIRDKVEGTRVIPLTPYVWHLLAALPRRNDFVFSSLTAAGGCIAIPRNPHHDACAVAGIDGLTVHGLRRSFKSLTEWLEIPAGVVAQIMGHKPSATAEKHYTVRPLDLLRVHHERIEAWILEQAGIVFDAKAEPGKLRAVN
ncbi:integrase family protein [Ottowia caeni]|uniref:tyrosine-type recombinase/integrase n=1 Tax=Ottowia caeni TaxID=2870339 RepID=UPI001E54167F|nr:integrase family protein [Ottowia caeni]